MAISRERLEELIKEEAVVYDPDDMWQSIGEIKLNKNMKIKNGRLDGDLGDLGLKGASCSCSVPLEDLVETKEDAEWFLEFGNITRTERLDLPSWEEFDKKGYFEFVGAYGTKLVLEKTLTVDCDREPISYYVLQILVNDYDHRLLFEAEYTKENYTLACRKAKELFIGDERDE